MRPRSTRAAAEAVLVEFDFLPTSTIAALPLSSATCVSRGDDGGGGSAVLVWIDVTGGGLDGGGEENLSSEDDDGDGGSVVMLRGVSCEAADVD